MDKIQDGHFSKSEVIGHYGRDEKKNVQAELKTVESKSFNHTSFITCKGVSLTAVASSVKYSSPWDIVTSASEKSCTVQSVIYTGIYNSVVFTYSIFQISYNITCACFVYMFCFQQ